MKYGPKVSLKEAWDELPMDEGYAYITAGMSLDGWLNFGGVKPADGESYVEQETERLMVIARKSWEKKISADKSQN